MDILENERNEEQKDNRFFVILGIIALLVSLTVVFIIALHPVIETINPVGNLIIIR